MCWLDCLDSSNVVLAVLVGSGHKPRGRLLLVVHYYFTLMLSQVFEQALLPASVLLYMHMVHVAVFAAGPRV